MMMLVVFRGLTLNGVTCYFPEVFPLWDFDITLETNLPNFVIEKVAEAVGPVSWEVVGNRALLNLSDFPETAASSEAE